MVDLFLLSIVLFVCVCIAFAFILGVFFVVVLVVAAFQFLIYGEVTRYYGAPAQEWYADGDG